ncbi:MAG: nitroreductase family protein [Victivallales bacterium]|nr:nitroreductase family protein [Victivallales bacterium]
MSFMDLARRRYSVRRFSDKPVPRETLVKILEAGNIAPTAKNQQPQRIRVLQSKEDLALIDTLTPCRYGAPVVLVFTYDEDEEWKNPLEEGVHSGVEDVSIVATHIMLQAADLGVESIWLNYFPNTKLEADFKLPSNERSVLLMPLGYAAEGARPAPQHTSKKPLDATVEWR